VLVHPMVMYRFGPARGASLAPLRVATAKKETLIGLDLPERLRLGPPRLPLTWTFP
jgi:hypothetical protein